MKTETTKRALSILLAICMIMSVFTVTAVAATWTPASTTTIVVVKDTLPDDQALIDELDRQANLFASEYAEKLNVTAPSVFFAASNRTRENAILLVYDESLGISSQGYKITISGTRVTVSASDEDGLFYGWREVLKQIIAYGSVSETTDSPDVAERSVSLDNGRKYFSVDEIKRLIREMSWNNMNTLVLHFSEDMGLGLESKLYPWLAGRDGTLCTGADLGANYDSRYLTQEELADIAAYAKAYRVDLVPSLDTPGHMNYIVKTFNDKASASGGISFTYKGNTYTLKTADGEVYHGYKNGEDLFTNKYGIGNYLLYNGKDGVVKGTRNREYSRGIDISNEMAVAFTMSLLEEYATLFHELGSTKIDIGGDELLGYGPFLNDSINKWKQLEHWDAYAKARTGNANAVAYDAFLLYMNDLYDLVTDWGYESVRMWNDDVLRKNTGWSGVVQLNTEIDVWFWSRSTQTASTYIEKGYELYNIEEKYCYYAMTSDYYNNLSYALTATPRNIYNTWSPYLFADSQLSSPEQSSVLGGAFAIWCDTPNYRSGTEVLNEALPMIRANAAKSWNVNADDSMTYKEFTAYIGQLGNCPVVDVYNLSTKIPDTTLLNQLIAESAEVEAEKDKYVAISYENYMNVVSEAKKYYTGLNLLNFTQASVDAMCSTIIAARNNLYTPEIAAELVAVIEHYDNYYVPLHAEDPFTLESWSVFSLAIQEAKDMLEAERYDHEMIAMMLEDIAVAESLLCRESAVIRPTVGISGAFQTTYIYQGKETARITVTLPRTVTASSSTIMVFDENGSPVAATVTEGAYNRRKPSIRTFYIDVDTSDLTAGNYTFYVRAAVIAMTADGGFGLLYSADAAVCSLQVK